MSDGQYGVIATTFGDVPIEILGTLAQEGEEICIYRLLRKTNAFPSMPVGMMGRIEAKHVIADDYKRFILARSLPEQAIIAELVIYEQVRSIIKQESRYTYWSGRIPDSAFPTAFSDSVRPYIDAIVDCAMKNAMDINLYYYGRECHQRYCFICTGDICIRFGHMIWGVLLSHVNGIREESNRKASKKLRMWPFK